MENPKTSTGLKSSEGKIALGGGLATLLPLILSAFGGENGAVQLTELQKTILLGGAILIGVAYIVSRGMAKTESR